MLKMPSSTSTGEAVCSYASLDKKLSKAFTDFCKRSAAEENLQFLTLVKKYKKSKSSTRAKLFYHIRDAHLGASTSANPVNLDIDCLEAISRKAEKAILSHGKLSKDLFDEAEEIIASLVNLDLLPKFQSRIRAQMTG